MKKLCLLAAALGFFGVHSVFAGEVCGKIYAHNVCGLQHCIIYNLTDSDRGPDANPYLLETKSSQVQAEIVALAAEIEENPTISACVTGIVGANNDPDQLMATSIRKVNRASN